MTGLIYRAAGLGLPAARSTKNEPDAVLFFGPGHCAGLAMTMQPELAEPSREYKPNDVTKPKMYCGEEAPVTVLHDYADVPGASDAP